MYTSRTRHDSNEFVKKSFKIIDDGNQKNILYCGVAGNSYGQIGDYTGPIPDLPELYRGHKIETLDCSTVWSPTITGDITDITTIHEKYYNNFDLIVITQVIEHVKNPHSVTNTLYTLLKKQGYAIIDCPWGPECPDYHAEHPNFGDYWRISDEGLKLIFSDDVNFRTILSERTSANAGILIQKI
jgi:hypothetical protein